MGDLTLKWKYFISSCILCTLSFGCVRTFPDTMPAKTREGRNTFGFFMNNLPVGGDFIIGNNTFVYTDSIMEVKYEISEGGGFNGMLNYEVLTLELLSVDDSYEMGAIKYETYNNFSERKVYELDSLLSNFVTVTYADDEKEILSGEFELNFLFRYFVNYGDTIYYPGADADSILLERGRFDLKTID